MRIVEHGYNTLLFSVWCIGIVRYKKLNTAFKILTWSVLAIFFISAASLICIDKIHGNWPVLQVECIVEFVFYALVYYYLFKNPTIKKTIALSIVFISIFFLLNAIFFQPFLNTFPTNVNLAAQLIFAIFSLLLFKEMLLYPVKVNIIKQSVFWYNAAILFYATTMFFALGISNYLVEINSSDHFIFIFWYSVIYLFHIFIGLSLLTDNKESRTTSKV